MDQLNRIIPKVRMFPQSGLTKQRHPYNVYGHPMSVNQEGP